MIDICDIFIQVLDTMAWHIYNYMGMNLICKSYGYRCTLLMRLLGLLRYDITSLFYSVIVEALESLLWFWYIYGIMCLTSFVWFYILRLNEYI